MKKTLALALIVCLCIVLTLSSCDQKTFEEATETPTEELKKFADPALIYKLQDGMNTEAVKRVLGAIPIELGNNIDAFMFTDGRVAYVSKWSGGSLEYDKSIAPDLVNQIKIGDSYSDVTQKLGANGVQPYNRYGCIGYCLSDGRELHIEFTPDDFVESFSVSDN